MIAYAAAAVFLISYALIATEKVHKIAAALGGVAGMVLLGQVDAHSAFFNEHTGIDWNVLFLLFGMMIVVSVLRHTGLFDFLALWIMRRAGDHPARLMYLLMAVTAVASPILDNVTTMLLVTPVALDVCDRLRISALPHLVALICTANVGGLTTMIADPPNIIIASRAGLDFDDFLIHSLPLSLILLVILAGLLRLMFRKQLNVRVADEHVLVDILPRTAITDTAMLVRCLVVLGLTIAAFALHPILSLEPSIIALMGAGAIVVVSKTKPEQFLVDVEWATLAFFAALFMLVGGLVHAGVLDNVGRLAANAMGGDEMVGAAWLLGGSAIFGALVDNIPYTTALTPVVEQMVAATPHSGAHSPLWWAFVFGADLSGNTTAVAAGANVVVLGVAARRGTPISFWQFTRYGLIVTAVSIVVAWGYVWLRYFA
ncbi:MAG: ArsB/NhaD family transporter [Propionibacteriaceae bacterium]|nr:ArsB/NhaD family transporter [Propionibacteriaceae bacterium]